MIVNGIRTNNINPRKKLWKLVSFIVPILIVRITESKVLGTSLVMRLTGNMVFGSLGAVPVGNVSPSGEIPYFLEPISTRRTLERFYAALQKAIAFELRLGSWLSIKIPSFGSLM